MSKIYIGIDPSINSTGVAIRRDDENKFYIIKPNKLTRKESATNLANFEFITYEKSDNLDELSKTLNIINIVNQVKELINKQRINTDDEINICIEGLSYGSVHTRSLCELSGLNFLLRSMLLQSHCNFVIAPPSVIKKFASGSGNCKKDVIVKLFLSIYPELNILAKKDDVADAYFMSCYAQKYFS